MPNLFLIVVFAVITLYSDLWNPTPRDTESM